MQVGQDLWTILDESWELIYCRYIYFYNAPLRIVTLHLSCFITYCYFLISTIMTFCKTGIWSCEINLRGNCRLFPDVGRIHLRCGSRWENNVHFRDGVGPFRPLSGPFKAHILQTHIVLEVLLGK